jgi:N utilization substance protein B
MSEQVLTENTAPAVERKGVPVRTQARRAALQALYQWQLNPSSLVELEMQFINDPSIQLGSREFFSGLLQGVLTNLETVDAAFVNLLDRPIVQLNPVELSVLRLGTYELLAMPETPYRVIINESIELAKTFGAEGGHAYVNGVLDKLGKTLRATELAGV